MELLFLPLAFLAANLLAACVLAVLKDLANHALWDETRLMLEKFAIDRNPASSETAQVEIDGRRAGASGFFLALFNLNPRVQLTANAKDIRKSTVGLKGQSIQWIPLSENVCLGAESRRSPIWLAASVLSLTIGVAAGLLMDQGGGFLQQGLNAAAWLIAALFYLFAYYQSHTFQLRVDGSLRMGVGFRPADLDGRRISFQDVIAAAELLMERIHDSRSLGVSAWPEGGSQSASPAADLQPGTIRQSETPPASVPVSSAPAVDQRAFHEGEETIDQRVSPLAAQPPERHNTGTIEFGEEPPAFGSADDCWDGPEPGTSDPLPLRPSRNRSEPRQLLGSGLQVRPLEKDEGERDVRDTDHAGTAHRGTVAWEEHADTTQDEMRAEAELAELKRSRPKRGEAKLRLRELMRRFPQTEAAQKAHRMLDRLESY